MLLVIQCIIYLVILLIVYVIIVLIIFKDVSNVLQILHVHYVIMDIL